MPSKSKASIVHLRKQPATVDHHLCQEFFFFLMAFSMLKLEEGGDKARLCQKNCWKRYYYYMFSERRPGWKTFW